MRLHKALEEAIALKQAVLADNSFAERLDAMTEMCVRSLKHGGRIYFCGNGGSAADAQHLAAELSGRFYFDRPPLNSEALHVNTSYLTAVANDYSYDEIYSRLLQGTGHKGDVLIGLSTSGNSANVVNAMKVAEEMQIGRIAFTGASGGRMKDISEVLINVPSSDTPRIQEMHIFMGHMLCEMIEQKMFADD